MTRSTQQQPSIRSAIPRLIGSLLITVLAVYVLETYGPKAAAMTILVFGLSAVYLDVSKAGQSWLATRLQTVTGGDTDE